MVRARRVCNRHPPRPLLLGRRAPRGQSDVEREGARGVITGRAEPAGRALAGDKLLAAALLAPDGVEVPGRAPDEVLAERHELDRGVAAAGRLYRLCDLLFAFEDEHCF